MAYRVGPTRLLLTAAMIKLQIFHKFASGMTGTKSFKSLTSLLAIFFIKLVLVR